MNIADLPPTCRPITVMDLDSDDAAVAAAFASARQNARDNISVSSTTVKLYRNKRVWQIRWMRLCDDVMMRGGSVPITCVAAAQNRIIVLLEKLDKCY
jgi:hypothetical protein